MRYMEKVFVFFNEILFVLRETSLFFFFARMGFSFGRVKIFFFERENQQNGNNEPLQEYDTEKVPWEKSFNSR